MSGTSKRLAAMAIRIGQGSGGMTQKQLTETVADALALAYRTGVVHGAERAQATTLEALGLSRTPEQQRSAS